MVKAYIQKIKIIPNFTNLNYIHGYMKIFLVSLLIIYSYDISFGVIGVGVGLSPFVSERYNIYMNSLLQFLECHQGFFFMFLCIISFCSLEFNIF